MKFGIDGSLFAVFGVKRIAAVLDWLDGLVNNNPIRSDSSTCVAVGFSWNEICLSNHL